MSGVRQSCMSRCAASACILALIALAGVASAQHYAGNANFPNYWSNPAPHTDTGWASYGLDATTFFSGHVGPVDPEDSEDPDKRVVPDDGHYRLSASRIGQPFEGYSQSDLDIGSEITPPAGASNQYAPIIEPPTGAFAAETRTLTGTFTYRVFAGEPGTVSLQWKTPAGLDAGPTQTLRVSGRPCKDARRIYWTDEYDEQGNLISTKAPGVSLGALQAIIHYNQAIPARLSDAETPPAPPIATDPAYSSDDVRYEHLATPEEREAAARTKYETDYASYQRALQNYEKARNVFFLWKTGDTLHAQGRSGYVVIEYRTDKDAFLGIEIVDVRRYAPDFWGTAVTLGRDSRLRPWAGVETGSDAEPYVARGLEGDIPYAYQHTVAGVAKGQVYAIRPTTNDLQIEVFWRTRSEITAQVPVLTTDGRPPQQTYTATYEVVWPYQMDRYRASWPVSPQLFVRGHSLDHLGRPVTIPADLHPELMPCQEFVHLSQGATLSSQTLDANGPGRFLVKYSLGTPSGSAGVRFEAVKSVVHDNTDRVSGDGAYFALTRRPWTIGKELTDPSGVHQSSWPEPGYVHVCSYQPGDPDLGETHNDRYAAAVYSGKTTSTGQIFAVNTGLLEVWWTNQSPAEADWTWARVQWPSSVVRYDCRWPTQAYVDGAETADPPGQGWGRVDATTGAVYRIIIASGLGTGLIDPATHPNWSIYIQNDETLPGFNPNDEHALAFNADEGPVFALRDDLALRDDQGKAVTSEPFVLLQYQAPADGRWRFNVYPVAAEGGPYLFEYPGTAGTLLQPPMPLPLLPPYCSENTGVSGPYFEDRKEVHWALAAGTTPAGEDQGWVTADFGNGTTTLTDASKAWTSDQWVGGMLTVGTARFGITASTATTLTVSGDLSQDGSIVPSTDAPVSYRVTLAEDYGKATGLSYTAATGRSTLSQPDKTWTTDHWQDGVAVVSGALYPVLSNTATALTLRGDATVGGTVTAASALPLEFQVQTETSRITMRYCYAVQEGFYFPPGIGYAHTSNPATVSFSAGKPTPQVGEHVPWLDHRRTGTGQPGSPGIPENIQFLIRWPDAPELRVGETLVKSKNGLPDVAGQASVDVAWQQSRELGLGDSVRLVDLTRSRFAPLVSLPSGIATELDSQVGEYRFPELPPSLYERLSYDGVNRRLRFRGRLVEPPIGEYYLLPNVITAREKATLDTLAAKDSTGRFTTAVTALYTACQPVLAVDPRQDQTGEEADDTRFDSRAVTAGTAEATGYVTLAFQNNSTLCSADLPVSLSVIKVTRPLYQGQIKVIEPRCPFYEKLTLRHSGDFMGRPQAYVFQWKTLPDVNGTPPKHGDPAKIRPDYWTTYVAPSQGTAVNEVTIEGPGLFTLTDNWFVCRYRAKDPAQNPCGSDWSEWTDPQLAEGWIKRVLRGITPYEQRFKDLGDPTRTLNTQVSMISQAGPRYEGDVALNSTSSDDYGLIQIYQTVLNRGLMLSIDGGISSDAAPGITNALLLAAGRLSELYMLLGNEAYADAADPTLGIGLSATEAYLAQAPSLHAFMNATSSLLDEELCLLRGRDDTLPPGVEQAPIYNRLPWNFTSGLGEVAYALNYDIRDEASGEADGVLDEADAKRFYPQGHGDAWGHYLTAISGYYQLLRHPYFTWVPRSEAVLVGGAPVTVDYLDERHFAAVAAARARTGADVAGLTYRSQYTEDPEGQWQGYWDADSARAWGVAEWGMRAGQAAYFDWVVANAILPVEDTDIGWFVDDVELVTTTDGNGSRTGLTLPFSDDFEGETAAWDLTPAAGVGAWHRQQNSALLPAGETAHSGTWAMACNSEAAGRYDPAVTSYLTLASEVALPAAAFGVTLSWWDYVGLRNGGDRVCVEVAVQGADATWGARQEVWRSTDDKRMWGVVGAGRGPQRVDLASYRGKRVRFRFGLCPAAASPTRSTSRTQQTGMGWYLDDVLVEATSDSGTASRIFSDDFESGAAEWDMGAADVGQWHVQADSAVLPAGFGSHSGTRAMACNDEATGTYATTGPHYLVLAQGVDIPTEAVNASLSWWDYVGLQNGMDRVTVDISIQAQDGTGTWGGWVPVLGTSYSSRAWGVAGAGPGPRTVDLTAFAGKTIRLWFGLVPASAEPLISDVRQIDRGTVPELGEVAAAFRDIQTQLDAADAGLSPLGLAKNAVPFDIDPLQIDQGKTHFEQIADRAVQALNNAATVFNYANGTTQLLRRQADELTQFQKTVREQEMDYRNRLIEVFGYPYPDDIGGAGTYPSAYDGPDKYHYMYIESSELVGKYEAEAATESVAVTYTEFDVDSSGSLTRTTRAVTYNVSTNGFGIVKPTTWTGQRRAQGELQTVHSDLLQARGRFLRALTDYDNLLNQIEDQAALLREQYNVNAEEIAILNESKGTQQTLNQQISTARAVQMAFRTVARVAVLKGEAVAEAAPKVNGPVANDLTSGVRAASLSVGTIISEICSELADVASMAELDAQQSKEIAQAETNIDLTALKSGFAADQALAQLKQLVRQEGSLRYELYNQQEALQQTGQRYLSTLARGQRLLEERLRFRKDTAASLQESRYKDMAFRVFRNDALQKYRAQFDLAARYVYLAARAYDYETNLLDDDKRGAGTGFLTQIVRSRAIGLIGDGRPQVGSGQGDPGLADPLARMLANWALVLKGQLGFSNPQTETNRFSLRSELLHRSAAVADAPAWRAFLADCKVSNLLDQPYFRQYCRPFYPQQTAEPALVIPFRSQVEFGENYFGQDLWGGDSAYDSSNFATKIRSVGVWFSNYNTVAQTGLSYTPRVYLVPVGEDRMRSPTGYTNAERSWLILDQVIPLPFPIGNGDLASPEWVPIYDSLTGDFAAIRRYPSFRAYHDSGSFKAEEMVKDSRLIGRSVWNTQWLLIIPAGALNNDRDEALRRFIYGARSATGTVLDDTGQERDGNGISDIKIFFQTYAYSGARGRG